MAYSEARNIWNSSIFARSYLRWCFMQGCKAKGFPIIQPLSDSKGPRSPDRRPPYKLPFIPNRENCPGRIQIFRQRQPPRLLQATVLLILQRTQGGHGAKAAYFLFFFPTSRVLIIPTPSSSGNISDSFWRFRQKIKIVVEEHRAFAIHCDVMDEAFLNLVSFHAPAHRADGAECNKKSPRHSGGFFCCRSKTQQS
jgi:hypothetical protein